MPKTSFELRVAARKVAETVLNELVGIVTSQKTPANSRIAAARLIFERGYGQPTVHYDFAADDGTDPAP